MSNTGIQTDFFLGANTPRGFVSLFDELHDPYRDHRLYIIKGGPGCGKSTLMKRVAAEALSRGVSAERIHCGSDPDSLDGVLLPKMGVSICDGTAPHVVEPTFPGATEVLVDLGRFWNTDRLLARVADVRRYTLECAIYQRRCTRLLQAAGALNENIRRAVAPHLNEEKLYGYALRFCQRELPKQKNPAPGRKLTRYLSGVTPKGRVFFSGTVQTLADRVVAVADETGVAAGALIEQIGARALAMGYDAVFCRCPLAPDGESEHLILPQVSLAVVTQKRLHGDAIAPWRTIHARRFFPDDLLSQTRARRAFDQKLIRSLLQEAVAQQRQAKASHDKLEQVYGDAMDFDALEAFAADFCRRLFASPRGPGRG